MISMIRKILILLNIFLFMMTCIPNGPGVDITVQGKPNVKVFEEGFNFGYCPRHSQVAHIFKFGNAGSETLRIERVHTTCGCTKAPLEKMIFAPGEATELKVRFSTGVSKGASKKGVVILSNASKEGTRLVIRAKMDGYFELPVIASPSAVDLKEAKEAPVPIEKFSIFLVNNTNTMKNLNLVSYTQDVLYRPCEQFSIPPNDSIECEFNLISENLVSKGNLYKTFYGCATFQIEDNDSTRFTIPFSYLARGSKSKD